jgi:hypothetical protein
MTMRTTTILIAVVMVGCVASGERSTMQAIAGPSVTVAPRAAGELAVSWSSDPAAVRYRVFEGGALVADVFDSGGGAPATSWIASGLAAGEHCYLVASIYADGSTSDTGAAACAMVGGAAAQGSMRLSVPLFAPGTSSVFPSRFLTTSGGSGVVVQLPPLPVGATITQLDARVRDNATGPTTVVLAIAEQADDGFVGPVGLPSSASSGSGSFQTLTLDGQARQVAPLHTYYAGVFVNFTTPGTAPCVVSAIDVTYQPAPL